MGFQLILEPSRGSDSCCDPAARCELHAKTCEASTLQIARCEATAKVLGIPILRQTETRSAAQLRCHLHRRARNSYKFWCVPLRFTHPTSPQVTRRAALK